MAERDRAGIMHLCIGQVLDFAWALRRKTNVNRFTN